LAQGNISLIIAFTGPKKAGIPGIELNIRKKQWFERIIWIFNEQLTSFSLRSANFPPRPAVYLQLPTLLGGTPRPPILFMSAMTIPPSVQLRHIEY